MKQFILSLIAMAFPMLASGQAASVDSLKAFAQWWRSEGKVSLEARVGTVPFSQKDYANSCIWYGDVAAVADAGFVRVRLGVGGQYVSLEASDISQRLWLVRVPLALQFRLVDHPLCRLHVGVGLTFDHILSHAFISHTEPYASADNPDIGRRLGVMLQVPVTWSVRVTDRLQLLAQADVGIRLGENHEPPIGRNHWGRRTPEREVDFGMPLGLSIGLSYALRK